MSIYFVFSDECGKYKQKRNNSFLERHPYYARSALIMCADEWKKLNDSFISLKLKYGLPKEKEIKWSYAWSLRNYYKKQEPITKNNELYFLRSYSYHRLIRFYNSALRLIGQLTYKKIICTIADNSEMPKIAELLFLRMHLQDIMQRTEMELQSNTSNLGIIFIDSLESKTDKYLGTAYSDIFRGGDLIKNYRHIKDGICIEHSHQSVGIQIVDFIAGAFVSYLKSLRKIGYEKGAEMFKLHVLPNLRIGKNGKLLGYGILVVPSQEKLKTYLSHHLECKIANDSISIIDDDAFTY